MFRNLLILVASILFFSCSTDEKKQPFIKSQINVPIFNADSAYYFIEKQVSFGPRALSSKGWKECKSYLEKKLKLYTNNNVIIQKFNITTYDNKHHTLNNIIASFSPEKNDRLVLFAHWDTRPIADQDINDKEKPILGANDGGSGVGVLLEIARQLRQKESKLGIDIILFDAEDYGQPENSNFPTKKNSWCLGSQHWAKKPHKKNYYARYGILLDIVGGINPVFFQEETSRYFASEIVETVWGRAHKLGYGNYFSFEKSPQIIDDHYYVNTIIGIPTIDIIEYDPSTKHHFNKHWHTHSDNMNNIDKKSLKAVGQTVLDVIYNE